MLDTAFPIPQIWLLVTEPSSLLTATALFSLKALLKLLFCRTAVVGGGVAIIGRLAQPSLSRLSPLLLLLPTSVLARLSGRP